MIKTLMIYVIAFALLYFAISFSQDFIYKYIGASIRFNFWDTNLFLAIVSFVICAQIQLFSLLESLKTKLGFVYLPTFFVKGILFYVAFKDSVFGLESLSTPERFCLIIPFLFFLVLEVYFVVKTISKNMS
ncbi:DUF6168 family protein [Winogradskyella endarachnes]|uniref:Uncharacterized protein n=1 Tax=Winogradskyella endarachnes TaxID=2681965 RepID=A0A6L6UBX9_9FLAO|nr:DUF6168 family protein [Winogradskyella endarachnes]MUU79036.1 hypothetical protein [Winogradskyella endarachnes]